MAGYALVKRLATVGADICQRAGSQATPDQALRASETINRATFELAAIGIAHVGIDGRWLRVNDKLLLRRWVPARGVAKIDLPGCHPSGRLGERPRPSSVSSCSGDIKTYSLEKRYLRKDRSTVWIVLTVSLVRTTAGEPLHFISVIEDITERKDAETELLRERAELAHVARVSTMGELAASVAHELNQPLERHPGQLRSG